MRGTHPVQESSRKTTQSHCSGESGTKVQCGQEWPDPSAQSNWFLYQSFLNNLLRFVRFVQPTELARLASGSLPAKRPGSSERKGTA